MWVIGTHYSSFYNVKGKPVIKLLSHSLLQVPGCPAAHRPRPRSASQWPGVDPVRQDDAARAAKREDLGGLLPPRPAVCLLPSTHHPLHLRQHPHLLVGVLCGFGADISMLNILITFRICLTAGNISFLCQKGVDFGHFVSVSL